MKLSILPAAFFLALVANSIAQTPAPAPSPSPVKPPADYDLRWAVKIPMRDKVELNATQVVVKWEAVPWVAVAPMKRYVHMSCEPARLDRSDSTDERLLCIGEVLM